MEFIYFISKYILMYILVIVFVYIVYLIYVEFKARLYLNVKQRIQELESKQKNKCLLFMLCKGSLE